MLVINVCRQGTVRGLFLRYLTIPPAAPVVPSPCAVNESADVSDGELEQYLHNLVQTAALESEKPGSRAPPFCQPACFTKEVNRLKCRVLSLPQDQVDIESRVLLLAALKPIRRPGWWKGKFASFQMPATWGEQADSCQKADSHQHPPPRQSGGKSFYRQREGATCRNCTTSSDRHPEVGHAAV